MRTKQPAKRRPPPEDITSFNTKHTCSSLPTKDNRPKKKRKSSSDIASVDYNDHAGSFSPQEIIPETYGPGDKHEYKRAAIARWRIKRRRLNHVSVVAQNLPGSIIKTSIASGEHTVTKNQRRQGRPSTTGRKLLDLIPQCAAVLPKVVDCPYCHAKKFLHETSNFCCSTGDVQLVQNPLPDIIKDLLLSSTNEAKCFKTMIRSYNNHLAFTSFGVKVDKTLERRNKGIYTFRVQGQLYHFISDLISDSGISSNLQFYFHDTDYEISDRMKSCPRLSETILSSLLNVLEENPYAKFFHSLYHIADLQNFQIFLISNPKVDQRVYNRPTVSQVSALWVDGEQNEDLTHRDIRVYTRGGQPRTIQYYYGCYDPLQYPLMFPLGDLGWHQGILKHGGKKRKRGQSPSLNINSLISPQNAATVDELLRTEEQIMNTSAGTPNYVSVREYYAYKFQIRTEDRSFLLHFGRLFQQYVVDIYVKLETQRLDFYKNQQDDLRNELLQGIVDAMSVGETEGSKIGQRIVLPSSFIGGPRHMRKKYIDAMALVQKYGKPDIFLTMTCNPNWPEITEHLMPNEHAQDRPDLVARVFHAKLEELKIELFKKHIFGEVAAFTYVIEFQKRGLPHAHFLLILKPECKLFSPEEYDEIVSAEIPDKDMNPHLYKVVTKHMLHGPCGIDNPSNVCMNTKGLCRSSYPKEFCNETTQTQDAYPKYRRRDNGRKKKVKGTWLDNRWVVPYNPYLLAKFDCHINVEICSTIKAVKYIYKYICKGNDKILFQVTSEHTTSYIDEIQQFVSARWISPPEAIWRIFRFSLGEMKPPVLALPLHLENHQPITFKRKQNLLNLIENSNQRKTMQTEFFTMNRTNIQAQELNCIYSEFPDHFVWHANKREWKFRKIGCSVGRIVIAHPTEGERYYLRLLLSNVHCPTSFDHLKSYNGVTAATFREAALIRGLLQDDNSQELCLEEASTFNMPYALRRLYSTLLVYCCPNNPKELWDKFEDRMCEDFSRSSLSQTEIRLKAFQQINNFLESMGKNITLYGILPSAFSECDLQDFTKEIRAEKTLSISDYDLNSRNLLNEEQKHIFNIITSTVYSNQPGAFFIDGPGGTGKTFIYRALLADIRSKGHIALATATSGIAASLLPGGRTAHSRFKIPIDISDSSICRISKQTSLASLITQSKLIIWDEAPMAKRTSIEALDVLLQDLMDNDSLFGGKVVVLGGDFRQILPVVRKGTKSETIGASLINSPLWPQLKKLQLHTNMRSQIDLPFTEFLLKLGNGELQQTDTENITLPSSILVSYKDNNLDSLQNLINAVYPNFENSIDPLTSSLNRAILTTKNHLVDEINDILITRFPGEERQYLSYDETLNPNDQGQFHDMLNALTPNGLPPHKLKLKKNAPIILLRNLDPSEGLCNGTRLVCKNLNKNVIYAEIAIGDFSGKEVFIHRIPLQPPNEEYYPVPYKRTQFPIRLCFAMTINKAQGQTLDSVGLYLKEPVFSHGQLYVALSGAKSSSCIKVLIKPTETNVGNANSTKNVVYKEMLEKVHSA